MLGLQVNDLPIGVGRIIGRPVAERSRSPLMSKNPDFLGCEVEQCRCNSRALHLILTSRGHFRPVLEQAKVHRAVSAVVDSAAIHKMLSFVRDISEVLERGPIVHRKRKWRIWC